MSKKINCAGMMPQACVSEFAPAYGIAQSASPTGKNNAGGEAAGRLSSMHYGGGIRGGKARRADSRRFIREGLSELTKNT